MESIFNFLTVYFSKWFPTIVKHEVDIIFDKNPVSLGMVPDLLHDDFRVLFRELKKLDSLMDKNISTTELERRDLSGFYKRAKKLRKSVREIQVVSSFQTPEILSISDGLSMINTYIEYHEGAIGASIDRRPDRVKRWGLTSNPARSIVLSCSRKLQIEISRMAMS